MDIHDIHRVEAAVGDHIEEILRKPCISHEECTLLQTWLSRLDYQQIDPIEPAESSCEADMAGLLWGIIIFLMAGGHAALPSSGKEDADHGM